MKLKIKKDLLLDGLTKVSKAISTKNLVPVLAGIKFELEKNGLTLTASDNDITIQVFLEKNEDMSIENEGSIIIQGRYILDIVRKLPDEFIKIMDDSEDSLELHIFNNKVLIKYQNLLFQSRLISGTYPNTANLLPDEFLLNIKANINDLYSVIDRASILTSDKEKNIVTFEIDNNKLYVRSSAAEIGRVEEKMIIEKNNNENLKISFVAKYMMDALKSFDDEKVEISFVGEVKPIILKSEKDDGLVQLVLPIRTY